MTLYCDVLEKKYTPEKTKGVFKGDARQMLHNAIRNLLNL